MTGLITAGPAKGAHGDQASAVDAGSRRLPVMAGPGQPAAIRRPRDSARQRRFLLTDQATGVAGKGCSSPLRAPTYSAEACRPGGDPADYRGPDRPAQLVALQSPLRSELRRNAAGSGRVAADIGEKAVPAARNVRAVPALRAPSETPRSAAEFTWLKTHPPALTASSPSDQVTASPLLKAPPAPRAAPAPPRSR